MGPYYNTAPIIWGTQKGTLILTTTHMVNWLGADHKKLNRDQKSLRILEVLRFRVEGFRGLGFKGLGVKGLGYLCRYTANPKVDIICILGALGDNANRLSIPLTPTLSWTLEKP